MKNFTQLLLDVLKVIFGIALVLAALLFWMENTVERDRELRTYISEGLALAVGVKLASIDFYEKEQRFPNDNKEVGLVEPNEIQGARVNAIEILPEGKIAIHYFGLKDDEKPQILLEAQVENGKINWICRDNLKALDHFDQKLLPAPCRE
ncbi:MAG: pilin [Wohlfahrtiimonas sp.]